jgi:hypothetical protein
MSGLTIDDSSLFFPKFSSVCTLCKHLNPRSPLKGNPTCKAFPERIPNEIWLGENDHTQPFPGDRGITFSKADWD